MMSMSFDGCRQTLLISMANSSSGFNLILYALKATVSAWISLALDKPGWLISEPGSWTSVTTLVALAFGAVFGTFGTYNLDVLTLWLDIALILDVISSKSSTKRIWVCL